MIAQPGSAVWFARHEWRLAWRDWLAMMTAGRRERLRRVIIAIAIFVIFLHFVAYWMVGPYADAAADKASLLGITASVLLSWLLMVSQAMESTTRAFYFTRRSRTRPGFADGRGKGLCRAWRCRWPGRSSTS